MVSKDFKIIGNADLPFENNDKRNENQVNIDVKLHSMVDNDEESTFIKIANHTT